MNALDQRLRLAWVSRVPSALNRIVEQEVRNGLSLKDAETSLVRLLDEIRLTEPDAEDREEEILGVMDRIGGWCHSDNRLLPPSVERHQAVA